MPKNFAVIGVGGYIAPRHLRAIRDTGNQLIAAVDPKDSVGILDQYSFDVKFFTEIERFDRHLEKLRRGPDENHAHYVSVCSPNYLHDAHAGWPWPFGQKRTAKSPFWSIRWTLRGLKNLKQETKNRSL